MVVVLGGGLGGLSAAFYLLRNKKSNVVIAEASNRIGGWIKSKKCKKTGVILEAGPRTIRPNGAQGLNTLALIDNINLTDKIIAIKSDHPAAKNRFIYVNKKLHMLPNSLKGVLRKTPPFSNALIFGVLRDLFVPAKKCTDDSLYNFVERRFGKEIAEYIVSAITCGICAGDAKELSVKFLMPSFFEAEQEHRSILIGLYKTNFFRDKKCDIKLEQTSLSDKAKNEKWNVWLLDGGLQTLTDSLGSYVEENGVQIMTESPCTSLHFGSDVTCELRNKILNTDFIISTLPAITLAPLVKEQHKILYDELSSFKFVTVGVVNLVFEGEHLKQNGFGFLVPPSEKIPILGIIFDSCINSSIKNKTVLTVMMGGKWFNEYFGESPKEDFILDTALKQVKHILQINQEPEVYNVNILKDCIPQYIVGHYERVNRIFDYIQDKKLPLSLCGSSFHGVGINDVILSSRKAVDILFNKM